MTKRAARARPVLLACVSDVHAGGTTALCPDKIALDDGGAYEASKAQRWLWSCWVDFWKHADAKRREMDATLVVVFNGDIVDGAHHGTTQVLSNNPNAQTAVVTEAVRVPLELKPDHIVIVRGTEAHVGSSASAEERIADGLRRKKRPIVSDSETGTASHWHFRAEWYGVLVDIAHHGRTGQREHTRGSAAVLHAHDILLSHAKRKERAPDLCLRAHHHKFNDSGDSCPTRVVTSGAWQLGTSYVHKVAPDSMADVGGLLVSITQDGQYAVKKMHYQTARVPVWKP